MKGFKEMNERFNTGQGQQQATQKTEPVKPASKPKAGDYIEFEEIK